jgi:hypothetical protein
MDDHPLQPTPPTVDTTAPLAGLCTIAVFEAIKGGLVLLVGVGLLSLLHRDVGVCRVIVCQSATAIHGHESA